MCGSSKSYTSCQEKCNELLVRQPLKMKTEHCLTTSMHISTTSSTFILHMRAFKQKLRRNTAECTRTSMKRRTCARNYQGGVAGSRSCDATHAQRRSRHPLHYRIDDIVDEEYHGSIGVEGTISETRLHPHPHDIQRWTPTLTTTASRSSQARQRLPI